jgi:hypothetical protein
VEITYKFGNNFLFCLDGPSQVSRVALLLASPGTTTYSIILYLTLFYQTLGLLRLFFRQLSLILCIKVLGTTVFVNPITWLLARSLMTLHFVSNLRSKLVNR